MAASTPTQPRDLPKGRASQTVLVWDPLVRLIHWCVALTILTNGLLTDPEGELHEWLGYSALVLVCLRLLWGLIGTPHAKFTAFPPSPMRALRHIAALRRGETTVHLSHNPLGALMVYNIWGTILLLTATGIMMGTNRFFGINWVKEAHEIAFDWLMFSVILHVGGVVFDTWLTGVPLVRAMINGRKIIPKSTKFK
jgi:cytochrome b